MAASTSSVGWKPRDGAAVRAGTSHGVGLAEALELGRRLGLSMPDSIRVYGVVVADPFTFGSEMAEGEKAAVPGDLGGNRGGHPRRLTRFRRDGRGGMDMVNGELKDAGPAAHEEAVLKQYGLRWAVLAGWRDALRLRQIVLSPEADHLLENTRVKIASGCFSVCEVGCGLSQIEGILTSADASSGHNWVDFWIDMLANSMTNDAATERILKVPAIKARYNNCGLKVCRC